MQFRTEKPTQSIENCYSLRSRETQAKEIKQNNVRKGGEDNRSFWKVYKLCKNHKGGPKRHLV